MQANAYILRFRKLSHYGLDEGRFTNQSPLGEKIGEIGFKLSYSSIVIVVHSLKAEEYSNKIN